MERFLMVKRHLNILKKLNGSYDNSYMVHAWTMRNVAYLTTEYIINALNSMGQKIFYSQLNKTLTICASHGQTKHKFLLIGDFLLYVIMSQFSYFDFWCCVLIWSHGSHKNHLAHGCYSPVDFLSLTQLSSNNINVKGLKVQQCASLWLKWNSYKNKMIMFGNQIFIEALWTFKSMAFMDLSLSYIC